MRSIFVLLILVMIGLNGKGQSVTALPDSVLSQCCLEVTLLNGNVTTVDWVFIQYITRDGTGTKLFVEYAPNFGGIQWETQIRIQDDFDDVTERSKFIMLPFTVGSTDYAINRNWVANIEENTTTGGTWVYGRFGTPTKRKFSAVEDYETLKNLLLACRPRAIVVAENGLYTEGDTVRMGGFLIEPTTIQTNTYNFKLIDTLTSLQFGISYDFVFSDTVIYMNRYWDGGDNSFFFGRNQWQFKITGPDGGEIRQFGSLGPGSPTYNIISTFGTQQGSIGVFPNAASMYAQDLSTDSYSQVSTSAFISELLVGEYSTVRHVGVGAYRETIGGRMWPYIRTANIRDSTATDGQFLQLQNYLTGEAEWATIDLSGYLLKSDTAAMLDPYIQGAGAINRVPIFTASRVIGNSNLQDNNTVVSILNSKPFALGQWTTAGRPTGTSGYMGYNTTLTGIDWYNGTRWATGLESTFARGTSTRIPFFDANGQVTESSGFYKSSNLFWHVFDVDYTGDVYGESTIKYGGAFWRNALEEFHIITGDGNYPIQIGRNAGIRLLADDDFILRDSTIYVNRGNSKFHINNTTLYGGNYEFLFKATKGNGFGMIGDYDYVGFDLGESRTKTGGIFWRNTLERLEITTRNGLYPIELQDSTIYLKPNRFTGFATRNPQYQVDIRGTDAIGIPRGTVAQRPTIASSTTPLRFSIDSTALEYGESVGTWRLLATRAYARSLVSGLTPDTWLGTRLTSTSVDINANANSLTIDSIPKLLLTSQSTAQLGGAQIEQLKWLTNSRSKYFSRSLLYDSRAAVSLGSLPAYYNLLKWNLGSGEDYEWAGEMQFDTTNLVFIHGFGGRYKSGLSNFKAQRPNNSSYILTPAFDFLEGNAANTGRNGSIFMTGRYGADTLFSIYRNGTFSLKKYGAGNKEAADLSKTQSNYIAGFATDGTLLDYSLSNLPNGIYTGSGTLASHTTRTVIPSTGNLLFTQKYNSNADSAFIQVVNNLDGNREVRLGLTDTASIGRATLVLKQDADNEVMAWDLQSSDGLGSTRLTGDGGNISATVDEGFEFQISGMVRAKRESYYEVTSTTSPDTLSNVYSDNLINQGGTQATFTLVMPPSPEDGQICTITYNNAISTLIIDGNGETIVGSAVTTGVPGSQRKFKFYTGIGWIKIY